MHIVFTETKRIIMEIKDHDLLPPDWFKDSEYEYANWSDCEIINEFKELGDVVQEETLTLDFEGEC